MLGVLIRALWRWWRQNHTEVGRAEERERIKAEALLAEPKESWFTKED